jgi:uncharacterized sporulation protein YeaH/YhbH (DUF444 family)
MYNTVLNATTGTTAVQTTLRIVPGTYPGASFRKYAHDAMYGDKHMYDNNRTSNYLPAIDPKVPMLGTTPDTTTRVVSGAALAVAHAR